MTRDPSDRSSFLDSISDNSLVRGALAGYLLGYTALTSRYPLGTNVYDSEWDLLIVLDACRVDALRTVSPEYPFVGTVERRWSLGSTSKEWIDRTFTEQYHEEVERTAYLTANVFAHQLAHPPIDYFDYDLVRGTFLDECEWPNRLVEDTTLTADDFAFYDPAWFAVNRSSREDRFGVEVPFPDEMTDRAIAAGREFDFDRMIVHYMQPHQPYLSAAGERGHVESWEFSPFEALRNDEVSTEIVWNSYLDHLRYTLDQVAVLLRNIDAERVVITADHGELFGEFGLYNHVVGGIHPSLRGVPWSETTATDTGDRSTAVGFETDEDERAGVGTSVSEQLEALGYR
jgi:hypothetical protein